jgi:biopolymer transport protein ExbB/TolQ
MSFSPAGPRRTGSTLATFVLGLPLAALVVGVVHFGPLREIPLARYLEYPVQWAEVTLFCCALGGLLVKLFALPAERKACNVELLPRWDGKPVPVDQASTMLAALDRQPARIRGTYMARRVRAVLEFICQRRSVTELDDQLRALADTDAIAHDHSYSLVRLITWAMPILGFLGTVVGITSAIGGVTPEVLEQSLSQVTGGLAEAFDATAVALSLTMVTMFLTSLVERQEQTLLETVDHFVERGLAHRWQRDPADHAPVLAAVQKCTQAMTTSVETVVQKQAEVWAKALAEPERRAMQAQEHMVQQLFAGLKQAMEQTLQAHAQRLAALEQHSAQATGQLMQQLANLAVVVRDAGREQQASIARVAESIAGQTTAMAKLQEGESHLVHLQAVLHQNLAAIAGASAFEEAVHTLTAAVHMLTAKAGATVAHASGSHAPGAHASGSHAPVASTAGSPRIISHGKAA